MTYLLKKPLLLIALTVAIMAIIFAISTSSPSSDSSAVTTNAIISSTETQAEPAIKIENAPQPVKIVSPEKIDNSSNTGVQNSFVFVSKQRPEKEAKDIKIGSLDDLKNLFESLNYDNTSWQAGHRVVPRLMFTNVSEQWQKSANDLPVNLKKEIFFRLMAPLILIANEEILLERKVVENAQPQQSELLSIARRYRVIGADDDLLTPPQRFELLQKVDIVPPSLVLAQGAEESGWATSRFTLEGNAFFGQWDFSGNGMVPQRQRKELGNYGIARFDSPLDSVRGYLINLNTNNAYQSLREYRAVLRLDNQPITGLALATTLDKYSERGQAYIDGIQSMIRFNKLENVDEAYLSDDAPLRLIPAGQ